MRYHSDGKLKSEGICSLRVRLSCMLHAVLDRLPHICGRRTAVVLVLCFVCLAAVARMNLALAISVDGDFVGYAANLGQVDEILNRVRSTSADAVEEGLDPASSVRFRIAVGTAEADIADRVEGRIYDVIDNITQLYAVCADGEPVCAFSSSADAARALDELISGYITESTVSARFAGDVSIVPMYLSTDMLEGNIKALRDGLTVLTDEYAVTEQSVKYSTNYILDKSMLESDSERISAGQNGLSETDYRISRANGKLVSYEKIGSRMLLEPVTAVVRVGTIPCYSDGNYIWPADGYISSHFGARESYVGSRNHMGVDIAADYGDPVWAADGGTVVYVDTYGGYGLLIKIEHDNGDITYYAHCAESLVAVGDVVSQGDNIALMGSTGASTGVHVHFELRPGGGAPVDPETCLPRGVLEELNEPFS